MKQAIVSILLFVLFATFSSAFGQEENVTVAKQGNRYVSLRIKSLEKLDKRIEKQQKHLLSKLKRKEVHFANKLKHTDSLGYARYRKQTVNYDSIGKISKADSTKNTDRFAKRKNANIDSLKGVKNFADSKSGSTDTSQTKQLSTLQGKLNYHAYVNQLITQHTSDLKNLAATNPDIQGVTGMEKQVFYGKAKMNVFKEIEAEPTVAEDKAMECLLGCEGFEKSLSSATVGDGNSLQTIGGGNTDAAQLGKYGFQTKGLMQNDLQQKFGSGLDGIAKNMGGDLKDFQSKQKDLENIKQTKQSIKQLGHTQKPSFKVNKMRGLPFWKRFEKKYSWQISRAAPDGSEPAILSPAITYGFKQTPKFIYGAGVGVNLGLGQSFDNIRFSFEGIGYKTFVTWKLQYGIGLYAGYERTYSKFLFTAKPSTDASNITQSNPHSNPYFTESILIGLTKKYHLNVKYSGEIQLLYDIWWEQKGLPTPLVLRFATTKN